MFEKWSELSLRAYAELGAAFGFVAAVITFVACWIYCITAYDVLLGVSFGWIPAVFCAGIIGWSVFLLWGSAVLFFVIAGLLIIATAAPTTACYMIIGGICASLIWRLLPR